MRSDLQRCSYFGLVFSLIVVSLLIFAGRPAAAQHVDGRQVFERVYAVVPLVGAGTADHPRRPAYAPLRPARGTAPDVNGIIGYTMQVSDDGKFALVEFVARDRLAFRALFADTRPEVKVFEKGKASRATIEAAFRLVKKDFTLDKLGVALP